MIMNSLVQCGDCKGKNNALECAKIKDCKVPVKKSKNDVSGGK